MICDMFPVLEDIAKGNSVCKGTDLFENALGSHERGQKHVHGKFLP